MWNTSLQDSIFVEERFHCGKLNNLLTPPCSLLLSLILSLEEIFNASPFVSVYTPSNGHFRWPKMSSKMTDDIRSPISPCPAFSINNHSHLSINRHTNPHPIGFHIHATRTFLTTDSQCHADKLEWAKLVVWLGLRRHSRGKREVEGHLRTTAGARDEGIGQLPLHVELDLTLHHRLELGKAQLDCLQCCYQYVLRICVLFCVIYHIF